jgi:hypothetical protein
MVFVPELEAFQEFKKRPAFFYCKLCKEPFAYLNKIPKITTQNLYDIFDLSDSIKRLTNVKNINFYNIKNN